MFNNLFEKGRIYGSRKKKKQKCISKNGWKRVWEILEISKKSKLSKENYNLRCVLNKDIYVIDGIQELAMQIRKIGMNINQVVHLANEKNV